jgi:hypothetical protein
MATASLTIEQVMAVLTSSPPRVSAATRAADPGLLRRAPAPGEWSATEILAHLRACADVWGDCIQTILAEDGPTIRAVGPRTWIESTDYRSLEFPSSLRAFSAQRAGLLAVLEPLPPEAWARAATVTGGGPPAERTVLSYADRLARHERGHLRQIERTVLAAGGWH